MSGPLLHLTILTTNMKPSEHPVGLILQYNRGCEVTLLSNETINRSAVYRNITLQENKPLFPVKSMAAIKSMQQSAAFPREN